MLSLVAVAIMFATSNAQDKKAPAQKSPEQRAERYLQRLNEEYVLTEAQKPKVKEFILKREEARDELRKKYADDNNAYATEFKKANAEADKGIKELLTPEQIEHQKQYIKEVREKNKENAEKRKTAPSAPANSPANKEEKAPAKTPPPPSSPK